MPHGQLRPLPPARARSAGCRAPQPPPPETLPACDCFYRLPRTQQSAPTQTRPPPAPAACASRASPPQTRSRAGSPPPTGLPCRRRPIPQPTHALQQQQPNHHHRLPRTATHALAPAARRHRSNRRRARCLVSAPRRALALVAAVPHAAAPRVRGAAAHVTHTPPPPPPTPAPCACPRSCVEDGGSGVTCPIDHVTQTESGRCWSGRGG